MPIVGLEPVGIEMGLFRELRLPRKFFYKAPFRPAVATECTLITFRINRKSARINVPIRTFKQILATVGRGILENQYCSACNGAPVPELLLYGIGDDATSIPIKQFAHLVIHLAFPSIFRAREEKSVQVVSEWINWASAKKRNRLLMLFDCPFNGIELLNVIRLSMRKLLPYMTDQ